MIRLVTILVLSVLSFLSTACRTPNRGTPQRLEFQRLEMGMPVRMVLYSPDATQARLAAKTAFDRIRELNLILSDYEDDSELNRLRHTSGSGRWMPLSRELWNVLRHADQLARETHGAFDITAGPLIQLWKRARRQRALPDPAKLAEARTRVGHYYLDYRSRDRAAVLWRAGMRLDLGGIAKGFVMDEAMKLLKRSGIRSALINAGGDIVVSGPPPGKIGWRIELPQLDSTDPSKSEFLLLRDAAFATSGDRYQFVILDGKRYSHIVDPRTGLGLTDHSLVYVVARDGLTADSLATAASVLEPGKARRLAERHNSEMRIQRKPATQLETLQTAGFARHLE